MFITSVQVKGVDLMIEFDYYRPLRGARGAYGEPLEPDEPGGVEICRVETFCGKYDLTDLIGDEAMEEISSLVLEGLFDDGGIHG